MGKLTTCIYYDPLVVELFPSNILDYLEVSGVTIVYIVFNGSGVSVVVVHYFSIRF